MRFRLSARLITLAALVPFAWLAVSGLGYARFRCALTGEVSADACGPTLAAPAMPIVRAASCCDRETVALAHAPVEPPTSHAELALAPSPTAAEPLPSVNTKVAIFIGKVPDPPATPLRVLKQSFLI
jgi:hypothetical protein